MFFITNSEDCVIGADEEFMGIMGVSSLTEIVGLKKRITFDTENNNFKSDELTAKYTKTIIVCPLGKVGLYHLEELKEDTAIETTEELALEVDKVDSEISIFTPTQEESDDTPVLSLEDTEPTIEQSTPIEESHMLEDLEKELLASMSKDDEPIALETETDNTEIEADIKDEEPLILFADEPTAEVIDTPVVNDIFSEPEEELFSIMDDTKEVEKKAEQSSTIAAVTEEPEEELFTIMDDSTTATPTEVSKPEATVSETPTLSMDEPLFDLGLDSTPTEPEAIVNDEVVPTPEIEQVATIDTPIPETIEAEPSIDIEALASSIGVDVEQYQMFLNDFISEAKEFENDLRGVDKSKSDDAVSVIEEASMLLGVTTISEKINNYKTATPEMKGSSVDQLMSALQFIENPTQPATEAIIEPTTTKSAEELVAEVKTPEVDNSIPMIDDIDDLLSLDNDDFFKDTEPEKPKEEPRTSSPEDALAEFLKQSSNEEVKVEAKAKPIPDIIDIPDIDMGDSLETGPLESPKVITPESTQSTGENAPMELITLDTVAAIPFDFSINQAADELTLPTDLVAEFVGDFIDQAKENLPVLQEEYNKRDLDGIEKTAHLLKGASSNLRIVHMAETLEKLQLNTEFRLVPDLIRTFAGQLKALDAQMGI